MHETPCICNETAKKKLNFQCVQKMLPFGVKHTHTLRMPPGFFDSVFLWNSGRILSVCLRCVHVLRIVWVTNLQCLQSILNTHIYQSIYLPTLSLWRPGARNPVASEAHGRKPKNIKGQQFFKIREHKQTKNGFYRALWELLWFQVT